MNDLPTEFDAIVVGTGMTASVVAAAFSRVGKSVLHLDSNEFYGENWASFNLDSFENWINTTKECVEENSEVEGSLINEELYSINFKSNICNLKKNEFVKTRKKVEEECESKKEEGEEERKEELTEEMKNLSCEESAEEKMHKLSRRFNLDLCPKLLFSKGMLVELLISSNIARYAEFKSVSRVLTWRNNHLEPVPCSRADVFATKNVSVVEKRILVKILTLFASFNDNLDEFQGFENKTFLEYLKHKKLPENLIHYILYAIAMGDNKTGCLDGVKACKTFLESLGRYGNTPFIFSMYGSGELPQCFCRLCAVFGGIYCLQRGIESLCIKDNKCVGVLTNGNRINAKNVILSSSYVPQEFLLSDDMEHISRGIFITDRSILQGEKESLTLLQFPPVPQVSDNSVTVIELGSGTCTCPENYFVVHLTTKMKKEAATDLSHVVNSLFDCGKEDTDENNNKPKVLWSVTWNVVRRTSRTSDKCPQNLWICSNVDSDLDYDFSISEAKRIFSTIYPDEQFLPRAPDPNEIVLDGEEKTENSTEDENGSQDLTTNDEPQESGIHTEENSTKDITTEKDESQGSEKAATEEPACDTITSSCDENSSGDS